MTHETFETAHIVAEETHLGQGSPHPLTSQLIKHYQVPLMSKMLTGFHGDTKVRQG